MPRFDVYRNPNPRATHALYLDVQSDLVRTATRWCVPLFQAPDGFPAMSRAQHRLNVAGQQWLLDTPNILAIPTTLLCAQVARLDSDELCWWKVPLTSCCGAIDPRVVAEVGAGVNGFAVGDRVASNGKHAEAVSVQANLCTLVPDGVADEDAAFTVLGAIALQSIRLVQPTLGEAVLDMLAGRQL